LALGDTWCAQDGDPPDEDDSRAGGDGFDLFLFMPARWSTVRRGRGPADAVMGDGAGSGLTASLGPRRSAWRGSGWGEGPAIGDPVEELPRGQKPSARVAKVGRGNTAGGLNGSPERVGGATASSRL